MVLKINLCIGTELWGLSGSELEDHRGRLMVMIINCVIYLSLSQHILTLLDLVSAEQMLPRFLHKSAKYYSESTFL